MRALGGLGRRGFCHYFCPFGVFGIVGAKVKDALRLPSVRLKADSSACASCHTCGRNCPMSLPVNDMVQKKDMYATECILCGTCVDGCPEGATRYSIGRRAA